MLFSPTKCVVVTWNQGSAYALKQLQSLQEAMPQGEDPGSSLALVTQLPWILTFSFPEPWPHELTHFI